VSKAPYLETVRYKTIANKCTQDKKMKPFSRKQLQASKKGHHAQVCGIVCELWEDGKSDANAVAHHHEVVDERVAPKGLAFLGSTSPG